MKCSVDNSIFPWHTGLQNVVMNHLIKKLSAKNKISITTKMKNICALVH